MNRKIKEKEKKESFLLLMTRKPLLLERKKSKSSLRGKIKLESEEFKWMHALHVIRQAGVIVGPQHCYQVTAMQTWAPNEVTTGGNR